MVKNDTIQRKRNVVRWAALLLQAAVTGLLFASAGVLADGRKISSVGVGILYLRQPGGVMHLVGGALYCAQLFVLPIVIWLVNLLCRPLKNFGVCVGLCAWQTACSAAFFTVANRRLCAEVVLGMMGYGIVTLQFCDLLLFVWCYLLAWQPKN